MRSNRNQQKNAGLSLLELMIIVSLFGVILFFISPNKWINMFDKSYISTKFSQDTRYVALKLERIAEKNATLLLANLHQIIFQNDEGQYDIYIEGFPSSLPPFQAIIQKDSETPVILADGLRLLTSPDRPGLEFFYFDQEGVETTVTQDVKRVEITLYFEKNDTFLRSQLSFEVVTNETEIQSR